MTKQPPLTGVRVADFSWMIAAPYGTLLLAELGAEVIKIECRTRPDEVRRTAPFKDGKPGLDRAIYASQTNAGKRSLTLDLNKPRGLEIARRLVAISDLVVENYRPGQMERWGLGFDDLKRIKPDMIMVRISAHGQNGPYARQPLLGTFFQGALGFHNLVGWPDREPAALPFAYSDYIPPWFLAAGALAALDYRRRTGQGVEIDVSQVESSPHFLTTAILDYSANGRVAQRRGNRSAYAVPNGVYRCQGEDRWVAVSVCNDEQWRALCRMLGCPELAADPRYSTQDVRRARADELDRLLDEWASQRSAEDAMVQLQNAGVPAGVVNSGEDLMERDAHLKARQALPTVRNPEIGDYHVPIPPFRLTKGSTVVRGASLLGQDNEYVCCRLLLNSQ